MSVTVPINEVAAVLDRRSNLTYLLTVGDDGRTHCVASTVEWLGDELVVPAGKTSARNALARGRVVILSPPAAGLGAPGTDEEGYSLIVDADVTAAPAQEETSERTVRVRPTHAVLHRPAIAADGRRANDCVPVYDKT